MEREVAFSSHASQLAGVCDALRAFCRGDPRGLLSESALHELELATNEAAANVVQHAQADSPHAPLALRFEAWPGRVVVRVFDRGDGFDPASVATPKLDGTQETGLGLYLIRQLVDECSYEMGGDGKNVLTLVKRG